MTVNERFLKIVEKTQESELIPFLKSLDPPTKRDFIPYLKELRDEYLTFKEVKLGSGSFSFRQKASDPQNRILNIASFVCLNRKDFEKHGRWSNINERTTLLPILSWYCPSWFNDYINGFAKNDWLPYEVNYWWVMDLTEAGYLKPSNELLIKTIPQLIYDRPERGKTVYRPENLTRIPITLEQHIWLIFELENTVHGSDRFGNYEQGKKEEENKWITPLKELSLNGKIDRGRMLRETLLATGRNFNKVQTGWYAELFTKLEPTIGELLTVQKELLIVLNSVHSKAVNVALQAIKKIIDKASFSVSDFLDSIPLLLSSQTRSVVSATLMILEKIAKSSKENRQNICIAICQAFIHTDEETQSRAAKIIAKYGDQDSEPLKESIRQYNSSLLMTVKNVLKDFVSAESIIETNGGPPSHVDESKPEKTPIQKISTSDELVFLASQAFDNNQSYHIDLLPASLVSLHRTIAESNLAHFEPALQRAYKIVMSDFPATMGFLDHLLATFFIDYTRELIRQFPAQGETLQKIHREFKIKETELRGSLGRWFRPHILQLETWTKHDHEPLYDIYRTILVAAFNKIKQKDDLPLLSTPTHEPCFIDPYVLAERLSMYQQRNVAPDSVDFQLAISRCDRSQTDQKELLESLGTNLRGEYLRLLTFYYTTDHSPEGPYQTAEAWMTASLIKSPDKIYPEFTSFSYTSISRNHLTGQSPWVALNEKYFTNKYNYKSRKVEKVPDARKLLRIHYGDKKIETSGIKNLILKWLGGQKENKKLLLEYVRLKARYIMAEANDIERFIHLFPNNPEPLLAQIISKCMAYNTFSSEGDKKFVTRSLEALVPLEVEFGEMGHLFIGTCMLSADKAIRSFAAELWIAGVHTKRISGSLLGQILGKMQSVEFAPLKRFSDLLSENLMQVSATHNVELEKMISNLLKELPDEPVTNLKKLLEIYNELVLTTNASITAVLKQKLNRWQTSGSLKKVVRSLDEKG